MLIQIWRADGVRLDVKQHASLYRIYVRGLRKTDRLITSDADDDLNLTHTISINKSDLRAAAEKFLYTYIVSGSEREIALPQKLEIDMTKAIVKELRDDPQVFDDAREYVYQVMERDAFPGFVRYASSNLFGKMWFNTLNRLSKNALKLSSAPTP